MLRLISVGIGIYPVVAHFGLWASAPRFAVGYLLGLLLLILLYPPRYKQIKNSVTAVFLLITVMALAYNQLDYLLIYMPPIVIPMTLLIVFLQSLVKDQIPLITQFAIQMEGGDRSDEQNNYTRKVTQLWAIIFAVMVFEAIFLALFASLQTWSWFTHIGNYGLITLVLIVEFIYRNHRFKQKKSNFKQFVIALTKYQWNKN